MLIASGDLDGDIGAVDVFQIRSQLKQQLLIDLQLYKSELEAKERKAALNITNTTATNLTPRKVKI